MHEYRELPGSPITVDGKICVMHPTFENIACIEQQLSSGIVALARKLTEGAMTLQEISVIIMVSATPAVALPAIENELSRYGITRMTGAVAAFFILVCKGAEEGALPVARSDVENLARQFPD